ncbi:hypothetical protein HDU79_009294 [Rhizoclosmatium sp. JEL0117]|nr:hypothetical protein HDU79_009294 [Rhizoclosmatium sp. JEL0117]
MPLDLNFPNGATRSFLYTAATCTADNLYALAYTNVASSCESFPTCIPNANGVYTNSDCTKKEPFLDAVELWGSEGQQFIWATVGSVSVSDKTQAQFSECSVNASGAWYAAIKFDQCFEVATGDKFKSCVWYSEPTEVACYEDNACAKAVAFTRGVNLVGEGESVLFKDIALFGSVGVAHCVNLQYALPYTSTGPLVL